CMGSGCRCRASHRAVANLAVRGLPAWWSRPCRGSRPDAVVRRVAVAGLAAARPRAVAGRTLRNIAVGVDGATRRTAARARRRPGTRAAPRGARGQGERRVSQIGFVSDRYPIRFTIPALGSDVLLVEEMTGEESLSAPYAFRLRMLCENRALAIKNAIGKPAALAIAVQGGEDEIVHGIVGRMRQEGTHARFTSYTAELYPSLWLLTHSIDTEIFQNLSVPEIVKQVLADHAVTHVQDGLTGSYDKREFCVQYQESAFDFVSRLLEAEGIAYYFTHADSAHTLVLSDDESSFAAGPGGLKIGVTEPAWERTDMLSDCSIEVQVTPGQFKGDDYNFETPTTDLSGLASGEDTTRRVYEYPVGRSSKSGVEALATRRVEALELRARVLRGQAHNPGLRPGRRVTITDHAREDANTEFVVWKVTHQGAQHAYMNTFEAFPADMPFRPARVTPSPRIYGCQTAMVVGKSGEEITTDQYGRIKVKFHWDQRASADDTSSCWVRVAQVWAGKQWGAFFLPRIGQEVVVTFLDGDPDRPLVTGSVYNAASTVPYALPANQTRSTIKSDSSKGGGGANEIRFEDKKGSEELFVQAQKDMVVSVLNNDALTVKGTRAVEVTGAETHTNKAGVDYTMTDDLKLTIGGKLTLKVTGDVQLQVTGNIGIQSSQNVNVKAGVALNSEATTIASKASATHNVEGGATGVIKGGDGKIN